MKKLYYIEHDGLKFFGYKKTLKEDIKKRYDKPEKWDYISAAKYYDVKDKIVWEVGAYLGFYAMQIAKEAKHVVAIEAMPENYFYLKLNVEANQIKNIMPINIAAWNREEEITMKSEGYQKAGVFWKGEKHPVNGFPLDLLNIPHPDVIRVQINGSEIECLQGCMETIMNRHPTLVVSAIYNNNAPRVEEFIRGCGYSKTENRYNTIIAEK